MIHSEQKRKRGFASEVISLYEDKIVTCTSAGRSHCSFARGHRLLLKRFSFLFHVLYVRRLKNNNFVDRLETAFVLLFYLSLISVVWVTLQLSQQRACFTVRTVAVVSTPATVFTLELPNVATMSAADDSRSGSCALERSIGRHDDIGTSNNCPRVNTRHYELIERLAFSYIAVRPQLQSSPKK